LAGERVCAVIAHVAVLVRDYDEAIEFFTGKLKFRLLEDTIMGPGKRWVLVAPPGAAGERGTALLLAKAATDDQSLCIGNQAGGRVFLFLRTGNFWRDYEDMRSLGVRFLETPREEPYGTVAVFLDLYGNKWDLLGSGHVSSNKGGTNGD
jgi:catechol 2,3-dioxygenase-like lactoylglutathione lyase family enzyme